MKETLAPQFSQSHLLANQAKLEMEKDGYITVVCPRCHKHPVITNTLNNERTTVKCKCGYIYDVEINF